MMTNPNITILSTFAGDILKDEQGTIKSVQRGGPALYLTQEATKSGASFILQSGPDISVEIYVTSQGEQGRVSSHPANVPVSFSKILTPYLLISTVLDEYDLTDLSSYSGEVYMDIQGYVRDGDCFGKKKMWNPDLAIQNKIWCLKGTQQEISFLPEDFLAAQKQKILLVTRGKDGCEVFMQGKSTMFLSPKVVQGAQFIGAGDTFFFAFIFQWTQTKDVQKSASYANQRAGEFLASRHSHPTFFGEEMGVGLP